ncbi:MAG: DUF1320 domain-containing protein [Thermodesulfobacteriota bacterium]|jgi:phage gp36-like protein|nr:MAG: DUF1320 domain-containing protein [Thermodesulfobacteriota bacterium]
MAYCIEDDIKKQLPENKLIELTDDNGDGVADTGVVDKAIADADAEIDTYLSGRYTVPLSPVPPIINKVSVDISIWNLFSRRQVADEVAKERYRAAVDLLKLIAKGDVSLGIVPEPAGGEQQIKTSRVKTDRTFTIGQRSTNETGSLDNY